ncbi:MAG: hypothetical protein QXV32_09870, partial [Conexivisphaerales archaeon]
KNHSIMSPRWRFYFGLPRWVAQFTKMLVRATGVIYMFNYAEISLWTSMLKVVLSLKYDIVPHVATISAISALSGKPTARARLSYLIWKAALSLADAVIYDPCGVPQELVRRSQRRVLALPAVLVMWKSLDSIPWLERA